MKLQAWIDAHPEVDAKIKKTVEAHTAFGDFVRGFQFSPENIVEWKNEQQRLFRIFDDLKKETEALMPPMDAIVSIDEYSHGQPLLAENMDLLGWEFDTDWYSKEPKGHAAFLKYREKGSGISFAVQMPYKVNVKDDVL